MKEHCTYCNKALFKMYMKQGLYSHVEDKDDYRDSKANRICKDCSDSLLREGHPVECPVCDVPVFALNKDRFKTYQIRRDDLVGIPPQPDPYKGAYIKCRHCNNELHLME